MTAASLVRKSFKLIIYLYNTKFCETRTVLITFQTNNGFYSKLICSSMYTRCDIIREAQVAQAVIVSFLSPLNQPGVVFHVNRVPIVHLSCHSGPHRFSPGTPPLFLPNKNLHI